MAIALISGQKTHNYGTTQARTISFASNVSNGSLIVALIGRYAGSPVTGITGGTGNTFTRIGTETQYVNDSSLCADLWYGYNLNGGFTQLTFNAAAAQNSTIWIAEFAGALTTDPLDKTAVANINTPSATPSSGNTAALAQADEMVFGALIPDIGDATHTITAGSGYGDLEADNDGNAHIAGAIENKIVAATTAVAATFSVAGGNVRYICRAATFKAAPPTTFSSPPPSIMRRMAHLLVR